MRYKTRPGVVLTAVCGEHVLVAATAARRFCPPVTVINESSAFLWDRLIAGASLDELVLAAQEEYEVDDLVRAREDILRFVEEMDQLGYLIHEDQGGEHEE